jgi:hypothetical protein
MDRSLEMELLDIGGMVEGRGVKMGAEARARKRSEPAWDAQAGVEGGTDVFWSLESGKGKVERRREPGAEVEKD